MEGTARCGSLWRNCKKLKTAQALRRIYLKLKISAFSQNLPGVDARECPNWRSLPETEHEERLGEEAERRRRREEKERIRLQKLRRAKQLPDYDYQADQPKIVSGRCGKN